MTVIVEQPEPEETGTDAVVALAAGAAVAEVGALAEEVAEVTSEAEVDRVLAEQTRTELTGLGAMLVQVLERQDATITGLDAVRNGLTALAGMFDEVVAQIKESQLPPPEPKTKDTAPRRKSDAHRFLYGGK